MLQNELFVENDQNIIPLGGTYGSAILAAQEASAVIETVCRPCKVNKTHQSKAAARETVIQGKRKPRTVYEPAITITVFENTDGPAPDPLNDPERFSRAYVVRPEDKKEVLWVHPAFRDDTDEPLAKPTQSGVSRVKAFLGRIAHWGR